MPGAGATPRASATACGPQHLSSARETQSCGQTFMVTPITSWPCSLRSQAATDESTPPLMPSRTRVWVEVALMGMGSMPQRRGNYKPTNVGVVVQIEIPQKSYFPNSVILSLSKDQLSVHSRGSSPPLMVKV